jgi:hypothetical protein
MNISHLMFAAAVMMGEPPGATQGAAVHGHAAESGGRL